MGRTPAGRSTLPSRGRPRSSDKHAALRADARLGRDAHRPACFTSSRSPGSRVGCGRELACRSTTNSRGRGALDSTGTCEYISSGWRPTARRTEGSTGWAARTARTVHRPSAEPAPQALGTPTEWSPTSPRKGVYPDGSAPVPGTARGPHSLVRRIWCPGHPQTIRCRTIDPRRTSWP